MTSTQQYLNLTNKIIYASDNNFKIQFRLRSIPIGEYILFHAYSVFLNDVLFKQKEYGLIEKHYYDKRINNQPYCIAVDNVAELVVTENTLDKPLDWIARIDQSRYRVISFAHVLTSIKTDYREQAPETPKDKEL